MDTRIYVMTHKKIAEIHDKLYIPMQVGKAGKESFGYLSDDTGDNISSKNASYCELTGMYWIWKNVECDIVGICHYRRYFTRNEKLLEKEYIESVMQKYPIIVPDSGRVKECANVYENYSKRHNKKDLDLCRQVIAEKYPEYVPAFDFSMQTVLMSPANMWITKKSIYDRYCKWLFDILFEVEKRIDMTGYDDYQKRVMGFLSERLFRVWLLMQPEAITEEYLKMIDPQDFENAAKRVELTYKCVKLKMEPILQMYRTEMWKEFTEPYVECRDDFDGKVPVWVCWWQGEHDMPELIRCCLASLKRNLPKDKAVLRFITLENCMQYVSFTENIIRKFNEGKISFTHLSDSLRAELLYRYGGLWIDATYYVSSPIPDELFEPNLFYTLKFAKPVWEADITAGRWSVNFLCAEKRNLLFKFLMESFWYYLEVEEELTEYYLMDYIIAAAFEELPYVRSKLEQCPVYKGNVFELHDRMNLKCTPERLADLKQNSLFYKLNRRFEYRKENLAGEQTMYGYITSAT